MSGRPMSVMALALLAVATVSGQSSSSAAKPEPAAAQAWTPARTSYGQPDLEGVWARYTVTPFERPALFADQEYFTEEEAAEFERRAALDTADRRGTIPQADVNSDGNQFWYELRTTLEDRRTSLIVDPPDGRIPPLTPEAERRSQLLGEARQRADAPENRRPTERCLGSATGNDVIQIFQAPGYAVILREQPPNIPWHANVIPLDGRPPLSERIRRWDGDSRGHWEGDALVVVTTHFRDETQFRGVAGNASLRLIQRYTRTSPDTLVLEVTTESPSYTRPWTYRETLRRTAGLMYETACHEGNYSMSGILAGARAVERTGATISGRIQDAAGQPMPDAVVRVRTVEYHQGGFVTLATAADVRTDARGEYRLFPVPPGEYYLDATPPAGPATAPGPQAVRTSFPSETRLSAARPIVVREREELRGMDITMGIADGFTISGEVTSVLPQRGSPAGPAGTPTTPQRAVTATVAILARDVNDLEGPRQVGRVSLDPSTGTFEIENVPPGAYDLYAAVPDRQNWLAGGAPQALGRIPVEVRDWDVGGLSIVIHASVDVRGAVAFRGRASSEARVRVALQPDGSSAKNPPYRDVAQRPVTPGLDGSFTIPGVPQGRYRVQLEGLAPDEYVADVRQGGVSVFESGFDVGVLPPGPIEVIVSSGARTIQGVVVDAAGKPVPFAIVVLAPELERRQNGALYAEGSSDSEGTFSMSGIAPGDYTLFAWQETVWIGARRNPAFIARYEEHGRPVRVAESSTVTAELTAIPAGR